MEPKRIPPPATPWMRRGENQSSRRTPSPAEAVTTVTAVTRFMEMSIKEFNQANFMVKIEVPWLDEPLWLVPRTSGVQDLQQHGIARGHIWTAGEMADLCLIEGLSPEEARSIGTLKAWLGLEITAVIPLVDDGTKVDGELHLTRISCLACRGTSFWRSVGGSVVCGRCHPPAAKFLVAEWIDVSGDNKGVR